MFSKTAVILTNSVGAPNGSAQKDVLTSLSWMGVSDVYRCGAGMMGEIIRKCVAETDLPIFLYVFMKNTGAVSLYKKFGFHITETVRETRYIMER